jgi:hypothetical protein
MNINKIRDLIVLNSRRLICSIREALPNARQAVKKPVLAGYLLLTAHRAQITLALSFLFLIFLAPIIVDKITGTILPPETSKKIFGLIKTQQVNPFKGVADVLIMTALWVISIGSVLLQFWLHIPKGLTRANTHAGRLAEAADNSTEQSRSRRLFKLALSITTDTRLESEIESSLQAGTIRDDSQSPVDGTLTGSHPNTRPGSDFSPTISQPALCGKSSQSLSVGAQGRYTVGPELGKGAMGVVCQAWDNVLDRKIAIKQLANVFSGDEAYATRFRREAKTLARLIHSNIVQVYDLIVERGNLWMALEYVDGGNLASYLKEKGFLSVSEAANIVIPVAEGLAYAHNQGIIHRDLKPANILLTKEHVPKISDFGIAKISQSSQLTQVGSVLGSPRYMSPEQCSGGSVDARSDIYSLGITLYELLTGKVPFEGDTSSVLARQIVEEPTPLSEVLSDISVELEKLILQMLAKSPDQRPADMPTMIGLLSSFKDEITV